jgi:hypothetical protein
MAKKVTGRKKSGKTTSHDGKRLSDRKLELVATLDAEHYANVEREMWKRVAAQAHMPTL